MADRDGAVAAGPPATSVADDPAPTVTGTGPSTALVGPRKGEPAEPPSFFDQPVRDADLGADRVVLDASPAEVVAGAQAETTELRAALDDLRRVLDDVDHAAVPQRRRRLPLVAVTGGVAAVVAIGLAVAGTVTGDDTTGEVAVVSSSATSTGTPSAGSDPSVSPSAASPQPSVQAPAGMPATGPGVTEPGTTSVVTVDADGTVQVYEQFLAGTPQNALPLTLAQPTSLSGDAVRSRPTLQPDVTLLLDGRAARPVPAGGQAWVAAPSNGSRFERAVIRYTVSGAFVLSRPAVRGRGLILLSPLTASTGLQLGQPVRMVTVGPQVVSITCPTLPSAATLCEQRPQGQTRTATIPAGSPDGLMMLAVTLPQAT